MALVSGDIIVLEKLREEEQNIVGRNIRELKQYIAERKIREPMSRCKHLFICSGATLIKSIAYFG